jgi:hypothetical protein
MLLGRNNQQTSNQAGKKQKKNTWCKAQNTHCRQEFD